MAQTRYSANFKIREDLADSITPQAMVGSDTDKFIGCPLPAAWLPVQFTKSNYLQGEDAFVISAFKPVALDTEGRVVPAGLRTALGGNSATSVYASTVLSYTTTDVEWGVMDLVTGERVAAAVSYTGEQVCDALIERGLVRDDDVIAAGGTIPVSSDAHVNYVIDAFISRCVGYVLQDVNVYAGSPELNDQFFTNYTKQHGLGISTRGQFRVPQRVAGSTTSDAIDAATLDAGGSTTAVAGAFVDDGEFWTATNLNDLVRYGSLSATAPVVAIGLAERPVAANTDRTPFTCDRDGVLVRERTSVALVTKEGDWYLDADVGVLFLHEDTWATLVALGSASTTFSYNYYTDTSVASADRYLHFDGPCRPGDFVTFDKKGNLTKATEAQVSAVVDIVGRVHKIIVEPQGLLDKVKTAWPQSSFSSASKMPGSATKGFSDLITLSGETVADQLVEVKFNVI